ncbi:MAG: creatininase family protein [Enterocloster sp.]
MGATEQHGPHLPTGTGFQPLAEAACDIAAKKLDEMGRHAVIAPTVTISNSLHHGSYPGTLSLDPRLYMDYLTSIARGIVSHGFRNICCVNGHGGNGTPTDAAAMDIVTRYGIHISLGSVLCGMQWGF